MDQFDDKISIYWRSYGHIRVLYGVLYGLNVTEAAAHQGLAMHEKDWEPRNPRNPHQSKTRNWPFVLKFQGVHQKRHRKRILQRFKFDTPIIRPNGMFLDLLLTLSEGRITSTLYQELAIPPCFYLRTHYASLNVSLCVPPFLMFSCSARNLACLHCLITPEELNCKRN
jgi:hypothetical protein